MHRLATDTFSADSSIDYLHQPVIAAGVGEADEALLASVGLDLDGHASGRRVDHVSVADHDADVAGRGHGAVGSGEEHQVPGPDLAGRDLLAVGPLLLAGAGEADPGGAVGHHGQPGAVEPGRPRAAELVPLCAS